MIVKNHEKFIIINHYNFNLEAMTKNSWRPIHFVCSQSNNLNSSEQLKSIELLIGRNVNLEVKKEDANARSILK